MRYILALYIFMSFSLVQSVILNVSSMQLPTYKLITIGNLDICPRIQAINQRDIAQMHQVFDGLSLLPEKTLFVSQGINAHNEAMRLLTSAIYSSKEYADVDSTVDLIASSFPFKGNLQCTTIAANAPAITEIKNICDLLIGYAAANTHEFLTLNNAFALETNIQFVHTLMGLPLKCNEFVKTVKDLFNEADFALKSLNELSLQASNNQILAKEVSYCQRNCEKAYKDLKQVLQLIVGPVTLKDMLMRKIAFAQDKKQELNIVTKSIEQFFYSFTQAHLFLQLITPDASIKNIVIFANTSFVTKILTIMQKIHTIECQSTAGQLIKHKEVLATPIRALFSTENLQNIFDLVIGYKYCNLCYAPQKKDGSILDRCGNCKSIRYCSRDCQTKDWAHHKKTCITSSTYKA